jgi:hypothetical protein
MPARQSSADPSRETWLEDERLIKRFEQAWQQGARPALADFLPADPARRTAVLIELVHADLENRLKGGEPASSPRRSRCSASTSKPRRLPSSTTRTSYRSTRSVRTRVSITSA